MLFFIRVCTDGGETFCVKSTDDPEGAKKFKAEFEGLKAIQATNTVACPEPLEFKSVGSSTLLALQWLDLKGSTSKSDRRLGELLARMHSQPPPADAKGFGFYCDNWCGETPQKNTWEDDWITFYQKDRLEAQRDMILKKYGDKELAAGVDTVVEDLPLLFKGVDVKPSLIHGDLWSGNWSMIGDNVPVVYDPAPYFGHHEAELSIMTMFGNPSAGFWEEYRKVIPEAPGFKERLKLYQLYHYMNHYTIFGRGYRGSCLSIVEGLQKLRK